MRLTAITLDCAGPRALAAFYHQAMGLELHPGSGDDFAGLTREDGLFIGFQRADGYQAPSWPDQSAPQQLRLDFAVDDLDQAEALPSGPGRGQAAIPAWRRPVARAHRPRRASVLPDQGSFGLGFQPSDTAVDLQGSKKDLGATSCIAVGTVSYWSQVR